MLPASEIGWRDFMADPRLQRLVEIALYNNRDLRVAALNVEQMQAQYRIQRAQLFPWVGAFADASRSRTPADLTGTGSAAISQSYSVGLSVSWTIDFFGRLGSLRDAALQQYFATAYARQATEILLVSQVADQYLTLLSYDELLAVTQNTLKTSQEYYNLVKLQFDTGTANELTLRQSEGVVEQAQANYTAYVRLRAQAENALVLLIGQPLPADLPPPAGLGNQAILTDIPAGLPSDLLVRRPDIQQAEATLRSANANIGAARAAFFPEHQPHRQPGHGERDIRRAVRRRFPRVVIPAIACRADLQRGLESRKPRCREAAEGHRHRPVRESDPDCIS